MNDIQFITFLKIQAVKIFTMIPSDMLIGLTACNKGCATILTFDKKAAQSRLFTLIG